MVKTINKIVEAHCHKGILTFRIFKLLKGTVKKAMKRFRMYIKMFIVLKKENVSFHICACSMIVRNIKKSKYINKLGIAFKNRNFHEKSFNFDSDSDSFNLQF